MTHLRQAMLDELQRRNYAKTTIQYDIQAVERFHLGDEVAAYVTLRF